MSKQLLILTGPQGSGNHMWSKIFSAAPQVQGWKELTETYWVGHGDEPFSQVWENPNLFFNREWPHEYYFTSISCPYISKGGPIMNNTAVISTPKYHAFIAAAKKAGFGVTVAVIGRDKNILNYQQSRVRKQSTLSTFLETFDSEVYQYDPFFISTELLYLYEYRYINQLSKLLDWPIDIDRDTLSIILKDNANEKYLRSVDEYWLDDLMAATTNGSDNNPNVYR
jgi:predicted ABC-type ATPase